MPLFFILFFQSLVSTLYRFLSHGIIPYHFIPYYIESHHHHHHYHHHYESYCFYYNSYTAVDSSKVCRWVCSAARFFFLSGRAPRRGAACVLPVLVFPFFFWQPLSYCGADAVRTRNAISYHIIQYMIPSYDMIFDSITHRHPLFSFFPTPPLRTRPLFFLTGKKKESNMVLKNICLFVDFYVNGLPSSRGMASRSLTEYRPFCSQIVW